MGSRLVTARAVHVPARREGAKDWRWMSGNGKSVRQFGLQLRKVHYLPLQFDTVERSQKRALLLIS